MKSLKLEISNKAIGKLISNVKSKDGGNNIRKQKHDLASPHWLPQSHYFPYEEVILVNRLKWILRVFSLIIVLP